jgi:hypothetical protein
MVFDDMALSISIMASFENLDDLDVLFDWTLFRHFGNDLGRPQ